jgi:glycosyltransferase involved in cell wall biosynthesis
MRLLYLTDRLSHRGGAPHHLLDVIQAMAHRHTVTVAAASIDRDVHLPTGVVFQKLGGLRSVVSRDNGLGGLPSLLKDADCVHIQNVMNPRAIDMVTTQPCVVTVQDHRVFCPGPGRTLPTGRQCDLPMGDQACTQCLSEVEYRQRMLALTAERRDAIARASQVIVLSDYMSRELTAAGLSSVVVIPPPVKTGPPRTGPGHGFLIAGRIVHHKGTDLAVDAWRRSGTDHPISIAGLGPLMDELGPVEQLGWLSRTELRKAMASARAVLFPARWQEPLGIVGIEALAMGTPVIAMATGGMSDWADAGTIVVPPGDVAAMASAIHELASDGPKAQRLGAAGSAMVRERFRQSVLTERLDHLYSSVVSGPA